ncbi:MAG: LTA synthase family protein [Clostridiales bacterium]|nr:LTA synthase family protein [Clostridiales bacterium]
MEKARGSSPLFRIVCSLFFLASLAVDAMLLLYAAELIARRNGDGILVWSAARPDQLATCVTLLFLLLLSAVSLFPVRRGIRLIHTLALLLFTVSYFKLDYRGEPLLLTDFFQAKEGIAIAGKLRLFPPWYLILCWAALFVFIPLLFPKKRLPFPMVPRLCLGAAAAVGFGFGLTRAAAMPLTPSWQYTALYEYNGFFLGLLSTRPRQELTRPEDYSRERIFSVLGEADGEGSATPEIRPDIFFVMSESLFDLASVTDLKMTADPLEGMWALMEEGIGAEAITPGYGGGTFYSEYEVLTGYRSKDTPSRLYYDTEIIRDGMKSVVSALKAQGYETAALHPNTGMYYNRVRSYKALGFDRRLFKSELGKFDTYIGPYPSDRDLFAKVLALYEKDRKEDTPHFYHIVTYQNHGAYGYSYDRKDIRVLNREGEEKNMAENYANAVLTHVEALNDFVDALRESPRPVLLVLWGDHAPAVGAFGVKLPVGAATKSKFYTTPLLIWNNYGARYEWPRKYTPTYRIGARILYLLGMETDRYDRWLALSDTPDMVTALGILEKNGRFYEDRADYDALDADMKLLHYDRLLGENYAEEASP